LTASKTRFGLSAIGKDVKPASDELYLQLKEQIQQLHQLALYMTVEHLAQKPEGAQARMAVERNSQLRIFENHRKEPPIEWERGINISEKDLPPETADILARAFGCYQSLLEARHENDAHKTWLARGKERSMRRDMARNIILGKVPPAIHNMLDVSERLACAAKPRMWRDVFEEYVQERESPSPDMPPRRGG